MVLFTATAIVRERERGNLELLIEEKRQSRLLIVLSILLTALLLWQVW
jgi:hypothetical protein